jgi:hypothetical protein
MAAISPVLPQPWAGAERKNWTVLPFQVALQGCWMLTLACSDVCSQALFGSQPRPCSLMRVSS